MVPANQAAVLQPDAADSITSLGPLCSQLWSRGSAEVSAHVGPRGRRWAWQTTCVGAWLFHRPTTFAHFSSTLGIMCCCRQHRLYRARDANANELSSPSIRAVFFYLCCSFAKDDVPRGQILL